MNNKGFTLIELVATIALIAVIAVISFVSINEVIKKNKINNCENLVKNIKIAVEEYVSDNRYNFTKAHFHFDASNPSIGMRDVWLNNLIEDKYISSPIKDPFTGNNIIVDDSVVVIYVNVNDGYTLNDIKVYNLSGVVVNCSNGYW